MKYNINDRVWWATGGTKEVFVTCPDCGGTKHIKLTMYDGSEHSIDCGRCSSGYNPPSGRIFYYEYIAEPRTGTISAVEIQHDGVEYRIDHYDGGRYCVKENDIFYDKSAALVRAQELQDAHNAEQIRRIAQKEKDTRSWAWNASYHRKAIKEAEKQIAYHTSKLNVAKAKANEPTHD